LFYSETKTYSARPFANGETANQTLQFSLEIKHKMPGWLIDYAQEKKLPASSSASLSPAAKARSTPLLHHFIEGTLSDMLENPSVSFSILLQFLRAARYLLLFFLNLSMLRDTHSLIPLSSYSNLICYFLNLCSNLE
jgi:hypothetical protein